MNNDINGKELQVNEEKEEQSRRELATKLGKFAIYAAPFTIMAMNSQAKTGSGPVKGKP